MLNYTELFNANNAVKCSKINIYQYTQGYFTLDFGLTVEP